MYKKTPEEISFILEAGERMGEILEKLASMVKPGGTAWALDTHAKRLIRKAGGRPAFLGYQPRASDPPFPSCVCVSVNDEVVHGIATKEKKFRTGDLVKIDIGMQYPIGCGKGQNGNGFFVDTAVTVGVCAISDEAARLVAVTHEALEVGIRAAQRGQAVPEVGRAIQSYVEPHGFGIVRDLVGHGVGHRVHEEPRVPNYYDGSLSRWRLEEGVVIAIEPMITAGAWAVDMLDDGWTIRTADGSLSAHFEHTIVVTKDGPVVATRRPSERA